MSLKEMFTIVCDLYDALMKDDIGRMLSLLTENAILEWGPFTFEGKERIKQWGTELRQMFIDLSFGLNQLTIKNNVASHNLLMSVTVPGGRRGLMKAMGNYKFKNRKIQNINITILEGILLVSKEELSLERYL